MQERGRELLTNPAMWLHIQSVAKDDLFFYVSHRHYLAQGLTRRQRVWLARYHYQHEVSRFRPEYHDEVYSGPGLSLWSERVGDTEFEIRLTPGADVLYEGGMSVVLYVDRRRVAVFSYSYVDRNTIFEGTAGSRRAATMFITRKQLSADHEYQQVFHPAFDRCTAAHMCLAALGGVAVAQGYSSVAAIRPEVHPSHNAERHSRFESAYARFWESLQARIRGRFAYELPVPMLLRPLEELSSKARRRAIRRRVHLERVLHSASDVVRRQLRFPGIDSPDLDTVSGIFPIG